MTYKRSLLINSYLDAAQAVMFYVAEHGGLTRCRFSGDGEFIARCRRANDINNSSDGLIDNLIIGVGDWDDIYRGEG